MNEYLPWLFWILYILLAVLIARRAKHMNRKPIFWFLVSMFVSPVIAMIIMKIIGNRIEKGKV